MKTYFTAIALLTLVLHAFARIGETEQQIETRYGKSTGTLESGNQPLTKAYRSSDLNIAVTYIDGVSQSEMFSKQWVRVIKQRDRRPPRSKCRWLQVD